MSTVVTKTVDPKLSSTSVETKVTPKVRRVRSRENYLVEGSITTENAVVPYALESNVWQEVPEIVYQNLRDKFGEQRFRYVLDHQSNADGPHAAGVSSRMRKESKPTLVIEGLEDE